MHHVPKCHHRKQKIRYRDYKVQRINTLREDHHHNKLMGFYPRQVPVIHLSSGVYTTWRIGWSTTIIRLVHIVRVYTIKINTKLKFIVFVTCTTEIIRTIKNAPNLQRLYYNNQVNRIVGICLTNNSPLQTIIMEKLDNVRNDRNKAYMYFLCLYHSVSQCHTWFVEGGNYYCYGGWVKSELETSSTWYMAVLHTSQ